MKIKNLNALKNRDIFIKDKKIVEIYSKLKAILLKYKKNNSFGIAVSGGPDSMALAYLSRNLLTEMKCKVYFILVDHGIRKNSAKEALQVKKILKKHNIKLKILKNKKKINKNFQKNARDVRYELLSRFCKKNKVKNLVTAHHKDDQIETFLIRLSRGSGVEGLSSMSEATK